MLTIDYMVKLLGIQSYSEIFMVQSQKSILSNFYLPNLLQEYIHPEIVNLARKVPILCKPSPH